MHDFRLDVGELRAGDSCRVARNLEKPGIVSEFSEPGKLVEFCATSEKNCNK